MLSKTKVKFYINGVHTSILSIVPRLMKNVIIIIKIHSFYYYIRSLIVLYYCTDNQAPYQVPYYFMRK